MKVRSQSLTALRALLDMALHGALQVPTSLAEIAKRQGLSNAFLEQLFRKLKAAHLVAPWRGMKGGYTLARPAAEISLLDVLRAMQDPAVAAGARAAAGAEAAVLLQALGEAGADYEKRLAALSLAEIKSRAAAHPLLKAGPRAGAGFTI